MYVLKCNGQYQKEGIRNTCSTEKYIFESDIVHSGIYAKSPYYKGAILYNDIPMNLQRLPVNLRMALKNTLMPTDPFCIVHA